MSIQAVAWALEQDLPARPKLVLVSLANHADHTNGYCWLKAETIARESSCTTRSIYRFIGGLVRNGYIRKATKKGDDGKQRANDYWIMFGREDKPWDWGAHPERDEPEDDGGETPPEDGEPQDVVVPGDRISYGKTIDNSADESVDKPVESCGPGDSRVPLSESLEPSKTKPKKEAGDFGLPPRAYRPPPPALEDMQGTMLADKEAKQVFVYCGTRAYEAWAKYQARKGGLSKWTLHTTKVIDGQTRTGWYFQTLFPPNETKDSTPSDLDDFK